MFTIALLQDNHNHPGYSSASLRLGGLGGTESSVIHLSEAFAARGHRVFALNRRDGPVTEAGVQWLPLMAKETMPPLDVAIGINSARVFDGVKARRTVVWMHNPPSFKQQLKRRNVLALLGHRPHAVLLSEYQNRLLHRWLPYVGRSVIPHGIAEGFILTEPDTVPRRKRAVFASQPSRGLAFVAQCWKRISAVEPSAELHVFCPQAKQEDAAKACHGQHGIMVRGSLTRAELAREFRASRLILIPGDSDETFCLAAAEATASGVPAVTLGIGALSERVRHGKTGFIATAVDDFAAQAIRLIGDDDLWMTQHRACIVDGFSTSWDKRVLEWETLFARLDGRN